MRRAQQDYEDKAMASRKEPVEPAAPAGPAPAGGAAPAPVGPPVDVRPSEREAVEPAEEGKPRPSERELAEDAAERAGAQPDAAEAKRP